MERVSWARRSLPVLLTLPLLTALLIPTACQSDTSNQPTPTATVVSGSVRQELRIGSHRVAVDRTLWVDFLSYQERTAAAQGRYLIVVLSVGNDSNQPEQISLADFLLTDSHRQLYTPATSHHLVPGFNPSLAAAAILPVEPYDKSLSAFGSLNTALVFDVPRDAQGLSLWLYQGKGMVGLE